MFQYHESARSSPCDKGKPLKITLESYLGTDVESETEGIHPFLADGVPYIPCFSIRIEVETSGFECHGKVFRRPEFEFHQGQPQGESRVLVGLLDLAGGHLALGPAESDQELHSGSIAQLVGHAEMIVDSCADVEDVVDVEKVCLVLGLASVWNF